MGRAVIRRHIGNAVAVRVGKRGHIARDRIPRLQLPAVFCDDDILKVGDGGAVRILRHDGEDAVGHVGHGAQHLAAVQVSHDAVQFIILQRNALPVILKADIGHLVQQQPVRVVGEVQPAAIQARRCHKIGHGGVDLCSSTDLPPGQVDADERIAGHAVRTDAQREGIEHLLDRNIAPGVGVAHCAAWHNGQIHRHTVIVGGVLHGVDIGVRNDVAEVMLLVDVFKILLGGKDNVILCKDLILRVAEPGKIVGIHGVHKVVDRLLRGGVCRNIRCDRDQLIGRHGPPAVRLLCQRKLAKVLAVLAAGYHIGAAVLDRLLDLGVGMAAQDQIEIGHRLGQQLVLGLALVLPCAAVGNADDHIHILVGLDVGHGLFDRLDRFLKLQLAGRGAGKRVLAENAHHGNVHIALLQHGIIAYAVCVKGVLQALLPLGQALGLHRVPVYIADHHGRDSIPGRLCAGQHIGKPLGAIVKLMIAEGRYIAPEIPQHTQLGRLRFKHGLDQRSH